MLIKLLSFLFPWPLRRRILNRWFGYSIHPTARIGIAWVFPRYLMMEANTKIDHFTVAIHLDSIEMEKNSTISRSNWITGFSSKIDSAHFKHQLGRESKLILKESAAITKQHHLDCTNIITIGRFSTIAGYQSQFLTHSIDIYENRQNSSPISIGEYCFVGTNVVVLGNSALPSYSILAAKSLLNKKFDKEYRLYGGTPAQEIKAVPENAKYFNRTDGFVI